MKTVKLTCVECPFGCEITVNLENGIITEIGGNNCNRGKAYAESEVVCPKRVLTSTVKTKFGVMLPVKTDKPVAKNKIFEYIEKISAITINYHVKIGDIIMENIEDGVDLIATDNL